MAQTAEEKYARDVTKQANRDTFGIHQQGSLSGNLSWMELFNRKMIIDILAHTDVDVWLTAAEKAELQGKLIIKS
jgi:hypothetical protein